MGTAGLLHRSLEFIDSPVGSTPSVKQWMIGESLEGRDTSVSCCKRRDVSSGYERMLATSQATGRKETDALERLSEPCVRRW